MRTLLFILLFIPVLSYGQGHFPIGGTSDTIDMANLKVTNKAYYQNIPTVFENRDFAPWKVISDSLALRGYVDINYFGAKPVVGFNNSPAIEAANKYASDNHRPGTYFSIRGVYESHADSLTIYDSLHYLGYGVTLKQINPNTDIYYGEDVRKVYFEGYTFQGLSTDYNHLNDYTGRRPAGIYINCSNNGSGGCDLSKYSEDVRVNNVSCIGFAHSGIYLYATRGSWITNCYFKGVGYLLSAGDNWNFGVNYSTNCTEINYDNNITDSTAVGLLVQAECKNVDILNSTFKNTVGQHAIYAGNQINLNIKNCIIDYTILKGILVQAVTSSFTPQAPSNFDISGNILKRIGAEGINVYNLSSPFPLTNVRVHDNFVMGNDTSSVLGAGVDLRNVNNGKVHDNKISHFDNGILSNNDTSIAYVNNQIDSSLSNAIILTGANADIEVNENIITRSAIDNVTNNRNGIFITGDISGLIVFKNTISDTLSNMQYGIWSAPTTGQNTIRGILNTVRNAPTRFETGQSIKEWSFNLSSYTNAPSSILDKRITVNNTAPDVSNNISISVPTVSGTTNILAKFTGSTSIGNSDISSTPGESIAVTTNISGPGQDGFRFTVNDAVSGITHVTQFRNQIFSGGGAGRTLMYLSSPNSSNNRGELDLLNETGNLPIMELGPLTTGDNTLRLTNVSGTTTVVLNTNGSSYVNGGNFGVGVTSPGEKMQVDGNIKANFDNDAAPDSLLTTINGIPHRSSLADIRATIGTVTSSAGTLNITTAAQGYFFTGTSTTWTLPTVASSAGFLFFIFNGGSSDITLNSNGGGNDIWDGGIQSNSVTIGTGQTRRVVNNGTLFYLSN